MRDKLLIAVATALLSPVALSASLRCDGDLIRPGDSVLKVLDSCGQPVREAAIVNHEGDRVGTALYYRYEYGPDRRVVMSGGEVARVERLD